MKDALPRVTDREQLRAALEKKIMYPPLWQFANDIPPVIWWNNFERIMLAVDDLECRRLLG